MLAPRAPIALGRDGRRQRRKVSIDDVARAGVLAADGAWRALVNQRPNAERVRRPDDNPRRLALLRVHREEL